MFIKIYQFMFVHLLFCFLSYFFLFLTSTMVNFIFVVKFELKNDELFVLDAVYSY